MVAISIFRGGQPEIIGVDVDIRTGEFHDATVQVTQLPIEDGSIITDHLILDPRTVEITAMVSNFDGDFSQSLGARAVTTWQELERLRQSRGLFDLVTTHELYSNMAITAISGTNEAPYQGHLNLRCRFVQIDITQSSVITVPEEQLQSTGPAPVSKSASSQVEAGRGEVITVEDDRSLLAQTIDVFNAAEAE